MLAIHWTEGDILHQQLVDILASSTSNDDDCDGVEEDLNYLVPQEMVEEEDEIDNMLDVIFEEDEAE